MKSKKIYIATIIVFLVLLSGISHAVSVKDKVAVLITSWGAPAGFNFDYAWNNHRDCRIGDRTQYPGQPCKIGHVGEFPYMVHLGVLPWGLTTAWPGGEMVYDNSGIYQLLDGIYVSMSPDLPSLTPEMISAGIPITPLVEVQHAMTGELKYPVDPVTGEDHLAGWYKIGSGSIPFPNGCGDLYEQGPLGFMRRLGILGGPAEPPEAYLENSYVLEIFDHTREMLEKSFGNMIDVRFGKYGVIPGYTRHEMDVAEDFAAEGFRKMLLSRETTDNNNYANEGMTGNYIKERLCEIGVLDEMEIYQTRQVGRTPEFNSMNVMNLKRFIEAYPSGTKIGIIYLTRGLPWGIEDKSELMGTQRPWYREVIHENGYLNYLSWKKAIQNAYGDRYDLVFTKGGVESDILEDNFFSYAMHVGDELGGHFSSVRDAIQSAKENGLDKIIVAPAHWLYDAPDITLYMRELNNLPYLTREDIAAEQFDLTYCEDNEGNEVDCGSQDAAAEITLAPSFSHLTREFATAYYVVLRGTLERFGLYPENLRIKPAASQMVTKQDGATVKVNDRFSLISGAKIVIPPDPYPDRPEGFTYETAVPINDPKDTNDCLWEDTVITISHQLNPPAMKHVQPAGPAVLFSPYRNFFNRDVTITLPYNSKKAGSRNVNVYIYNHVTGDWDPLDLESMDQAGALVTFKTQVIGLFRAGVKT